MKAETRAPGMRQAQARLLGNPPAALSPAGNITHTAKVAPQEHKLVAPAEMDRQALRNSPLTGN